MKSVIRLPVGPHLPGGEGNEVIVEVHLPEVLSQDARLFFCIPGGGMTRRYFDLDGGDGTHFSFMRAMVGAGHAVALVDPVGVGESTKPNDAFALNSAVVAELNHRALAALRKEVVGGVSLGSMPIVGAGHSAGALLTILQQANFSDFDAIVLVGFGSDGLPNILPPDYVKAAEEADFDRVQIVEMARKMFGADGYMLQKERPPETPSARALAEASGSLVTPVGVHAMTPGNVRKEMMTISCPVFLALGGRDMTGPAHLLGADYERCMDFTRYIIEGAGHHLFVAPEASALFDRIAHWARG
jgi:pimeloyl-ACP methyl ester carboxylesterase